MSGRDEAEFDRFAEEYDILQKENLGVFGKDLSLFSRYKVKLLRSQLNITPKTILEFGCGVGRNIPHLKTFFPHATLMGCDTSQKSLNLASEHNPEASYSIISKSSDLEAIYPEGADLILITCVLHHIPSEEHTSWLKELHKVLNPGGAIAIFEHNPYNPVTRHIFNTCPYDADAQLLYPSQCKKVLSECGFDNLHLTYTLFFIWRTSFWESIEKKLGWLPLGAQYCLIARKAGKLLDSQCVC